MADENTNPQQDGTQPQDPSAESVAELQQKLELMTEACKRTMADLANYRKRAEEEKLALASFGSAKILIELLSVLDNFERALKAMETDNIPEDHKKGIIGIQSQLKALLEKYDVKSFESLGNPFDPNFHEAIAETTGEKGTIIEEIEKGYMIGDKVLRPAKVKVGNGA
ncbi:MAG: GrpE protein, molecular chaperone GrpE [Candidatus Peregrinibacteria bacterium GW2011_GWC2_39_14]|nr:MAG: Protein GrpE [Candidatus Peregrinibacteria bacterium GW2011_GWA2_38_36]KKR06886.1 MAG: GrpE protein, molecular chaperone GrpE [Candidatus Peregrinibacteria bacterium GW2011_GWC2_39_14]